jgi:hypothetical protein
MRALYVGAAALRQSFLASSAPQRARNPSLIASVQVMGEAI